MNSRVLLHTREVQDLQQQLHEEGQQKVKLKMECDSLQAEIEKLMSQLATVNVETASLSSGNIDLDDEGEWVYKMSQSWKNFNFICQLIFCRLLDLKIYHT